MTFFEWRKSCFYGIYDNTEELEHSHCLSLSKAQREYTKYLESLITSADNESIKAVIKCGEKFTFEGEIQKTPDENELCNLKKILYQKINVILLMKFHHSLNASFCHLLLGEGDVKQILVMRLILKVLNKQE